MKHLETPDLSEIAEAIVLSQAAASFNAAAKLAGGSADSWNLHKNKTLEEVLKIMAPNGVRFCFCAEGHITKVGALALQIRSALPHLNQKKNETP
jgi:hypothetical protein